MPKIVITEIDQTKPGVAAEDFNVVYIPGFVDTDQSELWDGDTYVGLAPNTPTLFDSVSKFESLCGKKGAVFTDDQDYRSLNTGDAVGFASDAVPFHNTMFTAGDMDPSYIMAKELLNAGLCVLYERVNGEGEYIQLGTDPADKPEDWESVYNTYYADYYVFDKIQSAQPPQIWIKVNPGDKYDETLSYYKMMPDSSTGKMRPMTYVPTAADYTTVDIGEGETEKVFTSEDYCLLTNDKFYTAAEQDVEIDTLDAFEDGQYVTFVEGATGIKRVTYTEVNLANISEEEWKQNYWRDYYSKSEKRLPVQKTVVEGTTAEKPFYAPPAFPLTPSKYTMYPLATDDSGTVMPIYSYDTSINIKQMYKALEGVYDSGARDGLADKGNYSIKYLTSGGYPTYEYNGNSIVTKMMALAEERGDCVAFIDHTDNPYRQSNIDLTGSLYKAVCEDDSLVNGAEFATMFTPWAKYNRTTSDKDGNTLIHSEGVRMSATFAYLTALADSIKTNAPWLAVAGAARGRVLNLSQEGMDTNIPNGAADEMQPRDGVSVNAITNIKPYGWTIWGNRTLKNNGVEGNLTATSFLNVRNLVSDVKKTCYRAARKLTFEQNNDILWVNFKAEIAPTLDRMLSGYGISGYKLVRDLEHEKASEKATLCAKIILYPVYAVEDFYITIVLKDDEITVE